jgi:hypothetical protein
MSSITSHIKMVIGAFSGRFTGRQPKTPIVSVEELGEFVRTRSAYIMQKKLYDYVKTRMGTRYVNMFNDEVFIHSLNIAKMYVFSACLSDLTIYAVAHAAYDSDLSEDECRNMAMMCYESGISANLEHAPDAKWASSAIAAFNLRTNGTDWRGDALEWYNFNRSPAALIRYAPIADELKAFDRDIVENSINFAWRDIRMEFRKRLDGRSVVADWLALKAQDNAHHADATQKPPRRARKPKAESAKSGKSPTRKPAKSKPRATRAGTGKAANDTPPTSG